VNNTAASTFPLITDL